MRLLAILLAAVTGLGAGATATAASPPAGADYAALAETAASLARDDPAPADWTTVAADNGSAGRRRAFTGERGRPGWFGTPWFDVDGNGCDTRDDILARDLTRVTYRAGSACVVESGSLDDPYSGERVDFKRGKETSRDVQVDHVVPLAFVYAHGGWAWDADRRLEIANDPLNLLAVDGAANAAKSDSGPATSPSGSGTGYTVDGGPGWMPAVDECAYAARFTQVAARYGLGLGTADSQALASTLKECGRGAAVAGAGLSWDPSLSDVPELVRAAARRVEAWTDDHPLLTAATGLGLCLLLADTRRRGR